VTESEESSLQLLLVGGGRMGSALVQGWLDQGTINAGRLTIVEPEPSERIAALAGQGVTLLREVADVAADGFDVVVLAVKPQILPEVLTALARSLNTNPLYLTIAAGRTIASIQDIAGAHAPVIRMMPNTPAIIRRGVIVSCASPDVTSAQRALGVRLAEAVGTVHEVDDEALMDAVTALSGSGPAYVFLLIEAMIEAGSSIGLPEDLAHKLAIETVAGAALLAEQAEELPAQLRENVTSPGGTTAAALDILMRKDAFKVLISDAIEAAAARAQDLATGGD